MFIKIIHKFDDRDSDTKIMDWPWTLTDAIDEFKHVPMSSRCDCESCRGQEVEEIIGYPDFLLEWIKAQLKPLKMKSDHALEKIIQYTNILNSNETKE